MVYCFSKVWQLPWGVLKYVWLLILAILKHFWRRDRLLRLVSASLLSGAEGAYLFLVLWPSTSHMSKFEEKTRGVLWSGGGPFLSYFNYFVVYEVLLSLKYMLPTFIVFVAVQILSYYQAPHWAFVLSTVLQLLGFFVLALSGDFDTPGKVWVKMKWSPRMLSILVNNLKLPYFECSNPFEKRVWETDHFLTNGTQLYTRGFTLSSTDGLDNSRPRDRVEQSDVGSSHTLFTVEGLETGILVATGPRLEEQKRLLEYMAHHPKACFAKEVHGSRGTYWSIEEYPNLLTQEIVVCRYCPAPRSDPEPKLAGVFMF